MADRIQIRRDTAANWASANPVLAIGEMGFETDTNKLKIGTGNLTWNSLDYIIDSSIYALSSEVTSAVEAVIDAAPGTLDTLNELAASLADDADFAGTMATSLATKANTADLATVATSGAYADITGTPTLATVATTGAYTDVIGTPTLAPVATSGAYADITGTPTLATVATTGAYSDLTGTPTVPTALTDLSIVDGTAGQVLSADGDGTYTFIDAASGGGGSFEAVASGSLSDGSTVVLNADGTVAAVAQEATTSLLQTLNNPNAYGTSQFDEFGTSVAISGNYAIVGAASEADAGGTVSGKAYIFNVTTGALLHTLDNPNPYSTSASDRFGGSVALSGNYAIVGASNEGDAGGTYSGKAYIYNVTTGALLRTLNNPNAYSTSQGDSFGTSVAISDNYAIVGADTEDDAGGNTSGKAYIFNVTTGALVHTLNNPNAYSTSANDRFGNSVAIDSNYAIVGARTENDAGGTFSGKAYIFNVTTSALVHTLDNPNTYSTSAYDYFGQSVAISGNYAIVGAVYEDDASGTESGKAYIFNVTTGALVHTLDNPNAYSTSLNDYFGYSVSMSGNYAIVGAYDEDDAGGTNSGKAYIYNVTTGALVDTLDDPNAYSTSAGDRFGFSVSMSSDHIIVSAYREGDAGGIESGKAYIYSIPITTTNLTAENYAGIADAAYADAATATIQTAGSVDDAQSELTPGQAYYVQANGTLGLTPGTPSVFAGTAVSATKLLIGKEAPAATIAYADVTGTPTLATVATTGAYSDLTGTPTGLATETYVDTAVSNLVDTAPEALNTLNELAAALGDDANFAGTVTTSLAAKANTADLATVATTGAYSDLTGTPTVPTALTDLSIVDGTAGQVLSADGDGTYTFIDAASGGSGGTASFTSTTNLTAGDLVALSTSGTVSGISTQEQVLYSSPVQPVGAQTKQYDNVSVARISDTKYVVGYRNVSGYPIVYIATVEADNTVTTGTQYSFSTATNSEGMDLFWDPINERGVVVSTAASQVKYQYFSVTGTTIVYQGITGSGNFANKHHAVYNYETNEIWVAWLGENYSARYGGLQKAVWNGSAIVITNYALGFTFISEKSYSIRALTAWGTDKVIGQWYDGYSNGYRELVFDTTLETWTAISFTSDPIQDLVYNSTDNIVMAIHYSDSTKWFEYSVSGGVVSKGSFFPVATDVDGNPITWGTNDVVDAKFINGKTYILSQSVYEQAFMYSLERTAQNTYNIELIFDEAVPGSYDMGRMARDSFAVCGSGIVYVEGLSLRKLSFADLSVTNIGDFIGISTETVTANNPAVISIVGGINTNQSGLTPNLKYYATAVGALTTTLTDYPIGIATSATSLLVTESYTSTQKKTDLQLATVATTGAYSDLTGTPTGLATETYVNTAVSNLVDTAPEALNTLNELAAALGDDANFAGTVTTSLAAKANTADLATVATSGSYNDLTDQPAGGGSFEAVASGSLSDGSTVVLNADGTVSVVSSVVSLAGAGTAFEFEPNYVTDYVSVSDTYTGKIAIFWRDFFAGTTFSQVGTISGSSISFGPKVTSPNGYPRSATFDSNSNKVVLFYYPATVPQNLSAVVCTISGSSISFGSAVAVDTTGKSYAASTFDTSTNKVVVTYGTDSGDGELAKVGTISGNSISFGSETTVSTGGIARFTRVAFDSNSNKVVVIYSDSTNGSYGTAIVGTVSGTSISFGTSVVYSSSNIANPSICFDNNSNKIVVAYSDSTNGAYGTAIVGTVSGTSISFGAPVVFKSANALTTGLVFDPSINKVLLAFVSSNGSQYTVRVVMGTVSGTSISFGTEDDLNIESDSSASPVYDSASGKVLLFYRDTAQDGWVIPYQTADETTTNLTAENYAGIADAVYADAATATIQTAGSVDDAQSGLTPGQAYYVQADGTLATTPDTPRVFAGVAASATKLLIGKEGPAADLSSYASTSYVDTAVSNLVDTAPEALNTLNELAAALNDDANFAGTVTTSLSTKLGTDSVIDGGTV